MLVGLLFADRSIAEDVRWFTAADDDQFVIDDPLAEERELRFVQSQPTRRGRPPATSLVDPGVRRPRRAPPRIAGKTTSVFRLVRSDSCTSVAAYLE